MSKFSPRSRRCGETAARSFGAAAHFRRCDVSVGADVHAPVQDGVERFGVPDIVVNNAGTRLPSGRALSP